jgi:hypothetical protein
VNAENSSYDMHRFPNLLHSASSVPVLQMVKEFFRTPSRSSSSRVVFLLIHSVLKMRKLIPVVGEPLLLHPSQEPEYSWAIFRLDIPSGPALNSWPNYVHFNLADIT